MSRYRSGLALGIFIASLVCAVSTVQAGTVSATVTYPAVSVDGSPIPSTCVSASPCGKLVASRIEYGSCAIGGAFGTKVGEVQLAPGATTLTLSDVVPAVYCLRGFSKNDYGKEGVASNVLTRAVDTPAPGALTLAAVGSDGTVLTWTPPTANTDGSALTDLTGYTLYYGNSANALNTTLPIAGAVSAYTLGALPPGTWYFAIDSVAASGLHSVTSEVAWKVI